MHVRVGRWLIDYDSDLTRSCYLPLPLGSGCSCDDCLNFAAASGRTFSTEFVALATLIGVDVTKPAELCHWCREPSGLELTGGWFHFVGKIVAGVDSHQRKDGTGTISLEMLGTEAEVGFSRHAELVPNSFAGLEVCQLEFQTRVPWVLTDVQPSP